MHDKLDTLLFDQLKPQSEPNPELNRQILETCSKEKWSMKKQSICGIKGMKKTAAAALAACIFTAGGVTGFAAYHYLTPAQVATEISGTANALTKAFESKDAVTVNEMQTSNGYEIRLLGLVSGTDLSAYVTDTVQNQLRQTKTYAALAISRTDGLQIENKNLCVSPLINGVDWKTANNGTLDTGLCWFEKDGILYELIECDDLEIFSDRGVQIGVVDAFGDECRAFTMDKETGVYQKTADYYGTNALFDLPLDTAKADPTVANKRIKEMQENVKAEEVDKTGIKDAAETISDNPEISDFITEAIQAEDADAFLTAQAKLVETQTLPIKEDNTIAYENSEGGKGTITTDNLKIGEKRILGAESGDSLDSVRLNVYTLNADDTVTYEVYMPQ